MLDRGVGGEDGRVSVLIWCLEHSGGARMGYTTHVIGVAWKDVVTA